MTNRLCAYCACAAPCPCAPPKLCKVCESTRESGKVIEQTYTCPDCKITSYNANDAREKYCGKCHLFYEFTKYATQRRVLNEICFTDPDFTKGEHLYMQFQFDMSGDFYRCLWRTIAQADISNLEKLRAGYPSEVAAYLSWTRGDLADRVRAKGISC